MVALFVAKLVFIGKGRLIVLRLLEGFILLQTDLID